MIIFLEGLTKERKTEIAEILKKEFDSASIFTVGLIHSKIKNEKYNTIEFNYNDTVESFLDIPNMTFYLDDNNNEDRKEYLKEINFLKLDNITIDANNRNNEEIAQKIIDYINKEL